MNSTKLFFLEAGKKLLGWLPPVRSRIKKILDRSNVDTDLSTPDLEIRTYLLGNLPDSRADQIGKRYFTDRTFPQHVKNVENALIEEYLDRKLSRADRIRFELRYQHIPLMRQHLEEARQKSSHPQPPPPVPK